MTKLGLKMVYPPLTISKVDFKINFVHLLCYLQLKRSYARSLSVRVMEKLKYASPCQVNLLCINKHLPPQFLEINNTRDILS